MKSQETVWSVYILRCGDGSLYTGVALDVARRLEDHRSGASRGSRYLRGRGPLALALSHPVGSRSRALRAERAVKALSKRRKEAVVAGSLSLASLLEVIPEREAPQRLES